MRGLASFQVLKSYAWITFFDLITVSIYLPLNVYLLSGGKLKRE